MSTSCAGRTSSLGNSGTGKTHVALALGLAACQKGFSVAFTTAASLVNQLLEAPRRRRAPARAEQNQATEESIDPDTGEITIS